MAQIPFEEVYPLDTIVRIRKTGLFARITFQTFLCDKRTFQHYLAEVEGKEGNYCIFHQDVELECLPVQNLNNANPT
jgi:hypothetical protein